MMRKPIFVLAALMALPLWSAVQNPPATNPPPASQTAAAVGASGPLKLAYVNIQLAIVGSDEGKKEDASLQQIIDAKSAELQAKQKELETLKNNFDVMSAKLSDEARADKAEEIDLKDTALQRFQQDTQKEIDNKRQRWQQTIAKKMLAVIERVAKEKGLDMVEFYDVNRDGYVNPSLFITDDIIKAYNLTYPVAAAIAPIKK
jgi:Skp family chaperone for outer membrane proteins